MTYITDEQLEKATEQFASALTNKKSEEQYQKLWEQARYEGKPRYVDGVILSGHIFQKTLGDMKKMEQNTAILFGAIQSGKLDRDQLLKDFNKQWNYSSIKKIDNCQEREFKLYVLQK